MREKDVTYVHIHTCFSATWIETSAMALMRPTPFITVDFSSCDDSIYRHFLHRSTRCIPYTRFRLIQEEITTEVLLINSSARPLCLASRNWSLVFFCYHNFFSLVRLWPFIVRKAQRDPSFCRQDRCGNVSSYDKFLVTCVVPTKKRLWSFIDLFLISVLLHRSFHFRALSISGSGRIFPVHRLSFD